MTNHIYKYPKHYLFIPSDLSTIGTHIWSLYYKMVYIMVIACAIGYVIFNNGFDMLFVMCTQYEAFPGCYHYLLLFFYSFIVTHSVNIIQQCKAPVNLTKLHICNFCHVCSSILDALIIQVSSGWISPHRYILSECCFPMAQRQS